MSETTGPKYKIGDTIYTLWLSDAPIVIKYKGTKYVTQFPGKIVQRRIMTNGRYDPRRGDWVYESLDDRRQPVTIFETGISKTRYESEKVARGLIVDQVCAALNIFFALVTAVNVFGKVNFQITALVLPATLANILSAVVTCEQSNPEMSICLFALSNIDVALVI